MTTDDALRKQLLALLNGEEAHMNFDAAVANFPSHLMNVEPPNVPYTLWHLIEHLRITQWDILDYIRNPNYQSIPWPDAYWPKRSARATPQQWQQTIDAFHKDLDALRAIISDPNNDLTARIPHGHSDHHTILREILVVADHNAYHIGELGILRQVMNAWSKDHDYGS